jgi:Kef-type K+ transport system membrane component KefB
MTGPVPDPTGAIGHAVVATWLVPLETGLSLEPPFEEPVLVFGLAMLAFFTAPLLLERFSLPGIIGIILVGAAIGPDGLGLIADPEGIELLGEAGLVFLMFVAGLEINFNQFLEYKDRSLVFGSLSFLIPQAIGTVVGIYLLDLGLASALLFAAIFSSHTLLAYPVVSKLGLAKNEAMTATIGGTILTDTLALLVLAVVVASLGGAVGVGFWAQFTLGLAAFFVGIWVVVPRLGQWFFRFHDEESYFEFLFVMVVLFVCAILAELVGVKHIIGAFLAGLALNRLIPESGPLMNRIEFVGNALLIPFFLLWVGTLVDVGALFAGPETLVIAGSLTVMVVTTKLVASWLTGRVYDFTTDEVLGMFGLSVGQAAAALAIVLIGFEEGVPGFDQSMINGTVLMILIVSIVSPSIVSRSGRALLEEEERTEYDPSDTPQRVLVPVSKASEYRERLLDLALAIRDERSEEPVHTVSITAPGEEFETEAEVAEIEEQMEEMEEYAAGAEVPIESHTRVNRNVASGIAQSVLENRISTLVIGWDGARSRRQSVFGHILDQVLSRVSQLAVVGRIRRPINTTDRIVLVLPPGIDHNDGFFEALHTVKRLSERTGAPIYGLTVGGNGGQFERLSGMVEPEVPEEFDAVSDWKELLSVLRDEVRKDDLVALMSARRDDLGWHGELRTLPKSISTLTEGNFVVVYPAKKERADDRRFLQFR